MGEYAYVEDGDKAMFIDQNNKILKVLSAKLRPYWNWSNENHEEARYELENHKMYDYRGNVIER